MLGTGPFAVPTLRALYASPHEVLALVTRPSRPAIGKGPAPSNPMREFAAEHGTPILEPESINTPEARAALADYRPDLLVVCDYGQILKPETLAIARLGGINLHGSLLPKYRGAAPINWAIFHGENETGVTVIHMTPKLDAGPAIAVARTEIGGDETAADIEPRLAQLGAPLVLEAVAELAAGRAQPLEQDPRQATLAPRLKKSDGQVDWSRPALSIRNQVRAFEPWPKTYSFWQRNDGEPLRLILDRVEVEHYPVDVGPGTVIEAIGERLLVSTGQDALRLVRVQPSGKRVLSAGEFLRGYRVQPGDRFGGERGAQS
jgi:methionyl-tRNA formyltransferase